MLLAPVFDQSLSKEPLKSFDTKTERVQIDRFQQTNLYGTGTI